MSFDDSSEIERLRRELQEGNSDKVATVMRGVQLLSNTPEYSTGVDELTVKHFLITLAEVAMAVAQRRQRIDGN